MKNQSSSLFAVCAFLLGQIAFSPETSAASLAIDQNFRAPAFNHGAFADKMILLPDGKTLRFNGVSTVTNRPAGAISRYVADGAYDPFFNFDRNYRDVTAAAALPDGRLMVVATRYLYYLDTTAEEILRLLPDGTRDASFPVIQVSTGIPVVKEIMAQPDGNILVVGTFDSFAGQPGKRIVRLFPDGSIDPTFTPAQIEGGSGLYARPVVLGNGKILVAGHFTTVNGTAVPGITQLNADGSVDPAFQTSGFSRTNVVTRAVAIQADGRILMAGLFRRASSPSLTTAILRLNPDGSVDTSYVPTAGSVTARDVAVQADGKIVAAVAGGLYRYQANGGFDPTFQRFSLRDGSDIVHGTTGSPRAIALLPDGRIQLAGRFTEVGVAADTYVGRFGLLRTLADGTLDPSFTPAEKPGADLFPDSFARLADGSTLVAFSASVDPAIPFNVARLLPDGSRDPNFTLTSADPAGVLSFTFTGRNLTALPDGRFLISGTNDFGSFVVGKFLANGAEDLGFGFGYSFGGLPTFEKAVALPDGKVLLTAGSDPQATVDSTLIRMNRNGTRDSTFQLPEAIRSAQISQDMFRINELFVGAFVLAVQPDGRALFLYLSGTDQNYHLVRLLTDGSVDPTFAEATLAPLNPHVTFPYIRDYNGTIYQPFQGTHEAYPPILDAHVLADGRILVAGRFTSYLGTPARGLVRISANGTVDETFSAGGGAQWLTTPETATSFPAVENVVAQADGNLLISGTFEAFNGTPLPGLASLHPDGSVDSSFTPSILRHRRFIEMSRLAAQPDGSFLLGGPHSFANEMDPSLIHISQVGGIPVIGSAILATAPVGQSFSYQIVASGQPASYGASGLPAGFTFYPSTGLITGNPAASEVGAHSIALTASNAEGTSAPRQLLLTIPPPLQLISAVSRKTHGSAGTFDIPLPLDGTPGVECRSTFGQYSIVLTFNHEIERRQATVTSGVGEIRSSLYQPSQTLQFDLSNVADQQSLSLTVANIVDEFGQVLPDQILTIHFLAGDTNGNDTVNASDIGQTKSQSGVAVTADNFRADVNLSGTINASDVSQVKANAGHFVTP